MHVAFVHRVGVWRGMFYYFFCTSSVSIRLHGKCRSTVSLGHFVLDLFLSKEQANKLERFSSFLDFGCWGRENCTGAMHKYSVQTKLHNCNSLANWKCCTAKSVWLPLVPHFETAPDAVDLCKDDTVCRVFCVQHCRVFWSTWCEYFYFEVDTVAVCGLNELWWQEFGKCNIFLYKYFTCVWDKMWVKENNWHKE